MPEISAFCPACGHSVHEENDHTGDLRERMLGAVAYVGLLPAIVLLAIPVTRSNRFIRFHSWQGILFFFSAVAFALVLRLIFVVFSIIPLIGFLFAWLVLGVGSIGVVTLWVVLVLKAAQGSRFELSLIGGFAARLSSGVIAAH